MGRPPTPICRTPSCVNPQHMEPVTPAINTRRSNVAKLNQEEVDQIRELYPDVKQTDLAMIYGVGQYQISRIVNKKRWL